MGVMTTNRKRPEECMNVNHPNSPSPISSNSQRKRPKLSSVPASPVSSSKSTVFRISRYPEAKLPLRREVHAPCRPRKFDLLANSIAESSSFGARVRARASFQKEEEEIIDNDMGNVLERNYQKAKRSAFSICKYFLKGKEVIDLDSDSRRYEVSEDSRVEEVRNIGFGAVKRWEGNDGDVVEVQDLDGKVGDGGIVQHSTSSVDSELTNNGLKVLDAGNRLGSLALENELDVSDVKAYKKLLEAVARRGDRIERLDFEIELNERRRETFELLRPKKELVEEVPHEPFVALTKEEEGEVARAFKANRRKILVTHENSNIVITGEKFQCLWQGAWLNDEVINLYLELLKEREKREPQKFLKCHFFNTFFYKKLISGRNGYDFKSVRRWTSQRKLGYGLLECDKIFVPIHKEIHWCLAVINKKDQKFQYLDSLKGMDNQVLNVLARYFVDEVKDKTGKDIDVSSWEKELVEDLPQQENGFDCGVFMIKYADFYSRGLGLCFNQEHMPYFRRRTAKEILRLKAD